MRKDQCYPIEGELTLAGKEIDFDATYKVSGQAGVAWRLYGILLIWEPYVAIDLDDDGNEIEIESDEGEFIPDYSTSEVIAYMVGDDYLEKIDVSDLELISDKDYCASCGQIGCGWG